MIYDISIEKIGNGVNPYHSSVLWNKNIQYSILIDIDAHIKVIYIDSSHIKLLTLSPKY